MPCVGVVCGSGIDLGSLLDRTERVFSFSDFSDLGSATIPGHAGTFAKGTCDGLSVIVQSGRLHLYEGHPYEAAVRTVDVLGELGATRIVFTNAVGGLVLGMRPGDLVAIDRVRLARYRGWAPTPGMLVPDFLVPDCDFTGALQWVHGPCYETRAEIAAFQHYKMAVVGMSTGPELVRAQDLGIGAGIVSCVTNSCCSVQQLTHEQVVRAAQQASARLAGLLRRHLRAIAEGKLE